jgi:hypothetical protein
MIGSINSKLSCTSPTCCDVNIPHRLSSDTGGKRSRKRSSALVIDFAARLRPYEQAQRGADT